MIDYCSAVTYPVAWGFKREPSRPMNLRIDYCGGMKFNDNFDWNNLWYDAIQVNNNTILLIGPPLYDTKAWMQTNVKFRDSLNNDLPFRSLELDRVCYTAISVQSQLNFIDMVTTTETTRIMINHNNNNLNGRTVMFTLQKDNPIEWIKTFIEYYRDILYVNAFLIYDNGSKIYSINELETALQGLNVIIKIVNWPYPYGPQGSDYAPWDSDFGQYVMFEHAKNRYLSNASLVINNDIDELIVTNDITLKDIIEFLNKNNVYCLRYKGIWIEPFDIIRNQSADQIPFNLRHIKDYYCIDPNNKRGIGYKWMLIPNNVTLNQQWLVHQINGSMIESNQLFYGHLLSHNTNWSWKRDKFNGNVNDLIPNQLLLSKLNLLKN